MVSWQRRTIVYIILVSGILTVTICGLRLDDYLRTELSLEKSNAMSAQLTNFVNETCSQFEKCDWYYHQYYNCPDNKTYYFTIYQYFYIINNTNCYVRDIADGLFGYNFLRQVCDNNNFDINDDVQIIHFNIRCKKSKKLSKCRSITFNIDYFDRQKNGYRLANSVHCCCPKEWQFSENCEKYCYGDNKKKLNNFNSIYYYKNNHSNYVLDYNTDSTISMTGVYTILISFGCLISFVAIIKIIQYEDLKWLYNRCYA